MIPARTLSTAILAVIASQALAANIPESGLQARADADCQWFGTPPICRYKECPASHPKFVEKAWNKVGASPEHQEGFHTIPIGDGGCSYMAGFGEPQLYCCKESKQTAPEPPKPKPATPKQPKPYNAGDDWYQLSDEQKKAYWLNHDGKVTKWDKPDGGRDDEAVNAAGWAPFTGNDGKTYYQSCAIPSVTAFNVRPGRRIVSHC
ncbi:hypothetical protein HGRIS_010408 [Hohenbuehelia grisea]|uniref:WW domain-containing protein n=1 Tax=Hohenbuehelia grisea TaxID=104357 RepID=A0ABR3J476_9AGAR